jgi:hypothetical protein
MNASNREDQEFQDVIRISRHEKIVREIEKAILENSDNGEAVNALILKRIDEETEKTNRKTPDFIQDIDTAMNNSILETIAKNSLLGYHGGVAGGPNVNHRVTANHNRSNAAEAAARRQHQNALRSHSSTHVHRAAVRDMKNPHSSPLHQRPASPSRNASSLKEAVSSAAHTQPDLLSFSSLTTADPVYDEHYMCCLLQSTFDKTIKMYAIQKDGHCLYGSFGRFIYPNFTTNDDVKLCIKNLRWLDALYHKNHPALYATSISDIKRLKKLSDIKCLDKDGNLNRIASVESWGDDVSIMAIASMLGINAIVVEIDQDNQLRFEIYGNKVIDGVLRSRTVLSADHETVKMNMKNNISIMIGYIGNHFTLYDVDKFRIREHPRLQNLVRIR